MQKLPSCDLENLLDVILSFRKEGEAMKRSRASLQYRIWSKLGQWDYPYSKLKRIEKIMNEHTISIEDVLHPTPLVEERVRIGKLDCVVGRARKQKMSGLNLVDLPSIKEAERQKILSKEQAARLRMKYFQRKNRRL